MKYETPTFRVWPTRGAASRGFTRWMDAALKRRNPFWLMVDSFDIQLDALAAQIAERRFRGTCFTACAHRAKLTPIRET